jgi:hypothetical protein
MLVEAQPIASALRAMEQRQFVLPAIQREFVWPDRKITALFDSLMRGYPIGTFLFWLVSDETVNAHSFYGFVSDYDPRGSGKFSPRLDQLSASDSRYAVLDGQQRLTSLYIGLRGSHTVKLPRKRWDNPDAFPKRFLYLDVKRVGDAPEDDSGEDETGDAEEFVFRFRTADQVEAENAAKTHHWVKVADALGIDGVGEAMGYASQHFGSDQGAAALFGQLVEVVNSRPLISGYLEKRQQIDRVMNIFIRVNAQGEPLSFADLLLSQATAAWSRGDDALDAREEIREFVEKLNGVGSGFAFKRDQVMKACLYLTDATSVRFQIENYDTKRMLAIRDAWDEIKYALDLGARLLASFGFSAENLRAHSVIHPLAYYLHHRGVDNSYLTQKAWEHDREAVRLWVVRTMVKQGVWGSGLDTLLTRLRVVIREKAVGGFPATELSSAMAEVGKPLTFSDTEIETLLGASYGASETFALLSLLYPTGATAGRHHVDHIYPRSWCTKAKVTKAGLPEELTWQVDELPNLQLLTPTENISKGSRAPAQWLTEAFPDEVARGAIVALHGLGNVTDDLQDFSAFVDARRSALAARLRSALGVSTEVAAVSE